jgi:cytochrome c553
MTRLVLGVLVAAATCSGNRGDSMPPDPEVVEAKMRRHFVEISELRDAVIEGDLETIHERAQWMTEHEDPSTYPVDWRPHVAEVVAAAQRLTDVAAIDEAAGKTARLAASCGGCHESVKADPGFRLPDPPAPGDSVRSAMAHHQWATERMWEGIVGPSENAWRLGTEGFADAPGCDLDFEPEPGASNEFLIELCEQVGKIGKRAAAATDPATRAEVYGEFLTTCAYCHNAGA